MKMLPFYQCESWMIQSFGWGKHLGAYCLIYSFHRSGRPCCYSKSQFAEFLQCSRIQAIRVLNDLIDGEYINGVITPGSSTAYHINEEKVKEMKQESKQGTSIMDDTTTSITDDTTSIMDDTTTSITDDTTSIMDDTTTSITDDTTTSIMDDTQLYNILENKLEKDIREGDREASSHSPYGEFKNILLTDKQLGDLKKSYYESDVNDYIERLSAYKQSTGKNYTSDYATILLWMRQDGVQERDHSMDEYAELINNFDLSDEQQKELAEMNKGRPDYLKILKIEDNEYGGETRYYADGYVRVFDGYDMMVKEDRIGESGIVWQ